MNVTRNGKIARLPHAVRQELNRRLHDGELGRNLVGWLNGLPEVQAVLAAEFGGRPVREQNLSEWRQGGHRDWLVQQDGLEAARRLGEEAAELQAAGGPPLTDTLAVWLSARYAVAARNVAECGGETDWRRLREFCADLVELRRGDHGAARLKLEQERLRREQAREERQAQTCSAGRPRSPAERAHRIREVFGLPADRRRRFRLRPRSRASRLERPRRPVIRPPVRPVVAKSGRNPTQSNRIKPNQTHDASARVIDGGPGPVSRSSLSLPPEHRPSP